MLCAQDHDWACWLLTSAFLHHLLCSWCRCERVVSTVHYQTVHYQTLPSPATTNGQTGDTRRWGDVQMHGRQHSLSRVQSACRLAHLLLRRVSQSGNTLQCLIHLGMRSGLRSAGSTQHAPPCKCTARSRQGGCRKCLTMAMATSVGAARWQVRWNSGTTSVTLMLLPSAEMQPRSTPFTALLGCLAAWQSSLTKACWVHWMAMPASPLLQNLYSMLLSAAASGEYQQFIT